MILNNAMDHGESETCSLPRFLGRHKRMEDRREYFRGNAIAGISNTEPDLPVLRLIVDPYRQVSAVGHRLYGVEGKIEKDLHQLIMIAMDGVEPFIKLGYRRDLVSIKVLLHGVKAVGDRLTEVYRSQGGGTATRKRQELFDEPGHAIHLSYNPTQPLLDCFIAGPFQQILGASHDDIQRSADLMRHARSQGAQFRDTLGQSELPLRFE